MNLGWWFCLGNGVRRWAPAPGRPARLGHWRDCAGVYDPMLQAKSALVHWVVVRDGTPGNQWRARAAVWPMTGNRHAHAGSRVQRGRPHVRLAPTQQAIKDQPRTRRVWSAALRADPSP